MQAMLLERIVSLAQNPTPLRLAEVEDPTTAADEVLLKVAACAVCHTELDEIEGRTPPPKLPVIPGHQVVGTIAALGSEVTGLTLGARVGVGWIHRSTGLPDENLSASFVATGRDVNGGYAEYMVAPAEYVYPIPTNFTDVQAAPLLCAGAVGYRALKLTQLHDGQRLGLMGFGGSAHLVLPLARHLYPNSEVFVFARDAQSRRFALSLGAAWVGDITAPAPVLLDAIIDTTPAWKSTLR